MIHSKINLESVTKADKELLLRVFDLLHGAEEYISKDKNDKKCLIFECHSICRAVARNIPLLKVVDGKLFGVRVSAHDEKEVRVEVAYATHSWLETPDKSIIDPYPVGYLAAGPILVVNRGDHAPFGGNYYLTDEATTAEISCRKMWRKSIVLARIMRQYVSN